MDTRRFRQKRLGQNFLRSPRLARELVNKSLIGRSDLVYEIGPGRGIFTAELARCARRVVAIERDPAFVPLLRRRFADCENVHIVESDFLAFGIRATAGFKVFANIPFGITARVMRKLLTNRPIAEEIFLILQREAALKYSGAHGETLQSLLAKSRFSFEIVSRLKRTDFEPIPDVDSVFLKITRRTRPLIEKQDESLYRAFVTRGFCSWRPSARLALKHDFSYGHWKRLSRELKFPLNARPSELTFAQWLGLFRELKSKRW
jgi:23S rRNA (adenine-N6)-dimethyltransferase